jgi:hypothetical protein
MNKYLPILLVIFCFFPISLNAQLKLKRIVQLDSLVHKNYDLSRSKETDPVVVVKMNIRPGSNPSLRWMGNGYYAVQMSYLREHFKEWSSYIVDAGWLENESKISPELTMNPLFAEKWNKGERLSLHLSYFGLDENDAVKILSLSGARVTKSYPSQRIALIEANRNIVKNLLDYTWVMYVSPYSEERTPLAPIGINMNRVNRVHPPIPKGLGLQGSGVSIGVWDFGAAGNHVDFEEGLENVENNYFNNTGTQHTSLVTGAIVGRGVLRQDVLGMAPKAKVLVHNFFGDIIGEMRAAYTERGVRITNHSYNVGGTFQCFIPYQYDAVSSLLDDYVREKPDMTNVYAAGNSAVLCTYDFSTIVPGFQYAKNIITVGNLQNNETLYPGSARGPTTDGRLRPEVMAKGASTFTPSATGIVLTGLNQNYTAGFGTSFAAPQVAAITGLIQEAATELSNPMPSASLVKAILCNTAKDLGNPGPDYSNGFGMVDAWKAITSYQDGYYIEDSITHNQQKSFSINVPSGTAQLKLTLCWTDPATLLPAVKILTNDLDLKLVNGTDTILPWVLNPNNPSAVAVRGRDSLNNIEQITLTSPAPGTYSILVKGFDVPDGPQDFSIAYYFEANGTLITYPSGGEVLAANTANFVRWDAFATDSLVDVDYSLNGGATWTNIGTVPASQGFIAWTPPVVYSDSALVRLKNGMTTWAVSDSFFAIMSRPTTASLLACNYGIRIGWSTVTGATAYVVSQYEKGQWKDLDTVAASPYYITNAQNGKVYILAVRPISAKVDGPRSIATLLTPRPVNCSFPVTDIGMVAMRPISGRQLTSKTLGSSMPLKFRIQNFRNAAANFSVTVSWQVNGGAVSDSTFTINIPSNSFTWFTTANTYDFSSSGDYSVKAWLSAASDNRKRNDTIQAVIRQLQNPAMQLPFAEDFDSVLLTLTDSTIGLSDLDRFDFYPVGTARVNSLGGQIFAPQGRRALTLDNYSDVSNNVSANLLTVLNLTNYSDSTVYLDFKYRSRGESNANDSLFVRGSDTSSWIGVYDLYANAPSNAQVRNVSRINLSKVLQENGQNFSSSTEVRQRVNTNLTANFVNTNGGYTFDDFRFYSPGKDVEIIKAIFANSLCVPADNDTANLNLKLVIRNNFVDSVKNITLTFSSADSTYQLGAYDLAKFEIDTLSLQISLLLDSARKSSFNLWLYHPDDRLRDNDSLLNLKIRAVDIITSLPYYNGFESASQPILITVDGQSPSWQRGFPSKSIIQSPAEGDYAWVTGLNNNYNNSEVSSIYLGCLEPSLLDSNGQIAFHHIFQTEAQYDWVVLEYSQNGGVNWFPYGKINNGFNWFNRNLTPPGWEGQRKPWQVASYPLHIDSFPTADTVIFRLTLYSDQLDTRQGFAIDDIRILNKSRAIILQDTGLYKVFSNASGLLSFKNLNNQVVAYVNDKGQFLDTLTLRTMSLNGCLPTLNDRIILPRKFFFESKNPLSQAVDLTVYISNGEYLALVNADSNVSAMRDIGVMFYSGINSDDTLYNNANVGYSFLHPDSVRFLPYSNGYEVTFKVPFQKCEIYLSSTIQNESIVYHLNFVDSLPDVQVDSVMDQFSVALKCAGNQVFTSCSNGYITLETDVCGLKGNLSRPVINGVATFDSIRFARGPISNIFLNATYSGACSDTLTAQSNLFNILDTLGSPNPLPQILVNNQQVCLGDSLMLNVAYNNIALPATYLWSPGTYLNDSTIAQPLSGATVNTNYQVIVMDNDGCSDTASFLLSVLNFPVINQHPLDISGCYRILEVSASGNSLSYQWQSNESGSWLDIDSLDTDFLGYDNQQLQIIANPATYDSTWFRVLVTAGGLCSVTSDSAVYYLTPVILLPDTGTYIGDIYCDDSLWTYYSSSSQPGKFILAINWARDSSLSPENALAKASATVTLRVDEDYYSKDSIINATPYATFTMRRYWNVDIGSETLTEPVQLRFYYALSEKQDIEQAANDYIDLHIGAAYEGFEWFKTISGAFNPSDDVQAINVKDAIALQNLNQVNQLENGVLYALLDSIVSFSGGTGAVGVGPLNTPLPVELVYFNGFCKEGRVELKWETVSEFNADYFEVLRSADGVTFEPVARINAAGYSNQSVTYLWTDSSVNLLSPYYRLAQYDMDGKVTLYQIIQVECADKTGREFNTFYVPEKGIVVRYISEIDKTSAMDVFLVDGKQFANFNQGILKGKNEWVIPTSGWLPGLYLIVFRTNDALYSARVMVY